MDCSWISCFGKLKTGRCVFENANSTELIRLGELLSGPESLLASWITNSVTFTTPVMCVNDSSPCLTTLATAAATATAVGASKWTLPGCCGSQRQGWESAAAGNLLPYVELLGVEIHHVLRHQFTPQTAELVIPTSNYLWYQPTRLAFPHTELASLSCFNQRRRPIINSYALSWLT